MNKFDKVMQFVLKWEGGYVNNAHDPGGRTDKGVSERSHPEAWEDDVVTLDEAKEIYREEYWDRIDGDSRPYPEALAIMDFAVHSGPSRALKYWQRSESVPDYILQRFQYLTGLSSFDKFGTGWRRRIADLQSETEGVTKDVELIQFYSGGQRWDFFPEKVTFGTTKRGRTKIMARL